jgi:type IV pilus assembly protein PilW
MSRLQTSFPVHAVGSSRGFTLIELMVAVALGLLVSLGLVTLFGATSKTSRVQNAMAQMQENGRFAVQRLNYDLRMASRQLVNMNGFSQGAIGANGVVGWANAPEVFVNNIPFPDMAPPGLGMPAGWTYNPNNWWALSPRYFFQGYECSGGACSPSEPPSSGAKLAIPASGTSAGNRVPKSDVAVMRYLTGDGLSGLNGDFTTACSGPLTGITLQNATAASNLNASNGDLLMLVTNGFAEIFQVSVSGTTLTPINAPGAGLVSCVKTNGIIEVQLFNFSRNFVTVAYWLQLTADPNDASHLIPSLYRQQADNTGTTLTPTELVQGVEQMDFLYGVQDKTGAVSYADAAQVSASPAALTCSPAPKQYQMVLPKPSVPEAGCLWRSIKSVEVHLLLNSINNMYDLTPADMAYRYNSGYAATSIVYDGLSAPPATMPSGIPFGRVMRREFVAFTEQRNYNP